MAKRHLPTVTEAARLAELNLVEIARKKIAKGEQPSARELRLMKKYEKEEYNDRIAKGVEFNHACPRHILRDHANVSGQLLNRVSDMVNCEELRRDPVNLWVIIERLLRFPGEYKVKVGRNATGINPYSHPMNEPKKGGGKGSVINELIFDGEDAEWQQKCFQEKFYALRDQRLTRQGQLLPAEVIHDAHTRWAAILRDVGHKLALQYGNDAQRLLDQGIDDCVRVIEDVLSDWNASSIPEYEPAEGSQGE